MEIHGRPAFSEEKGGGVDGERGERRLREELGGEEGGETVINMDKVNN